MTQPLRQTLRPTRHGIKETRAVLGEVQSILCPDTGHSPLALACERVVFDARRADIRVPGGWCDGCSDASLQSCTVDRATPLNAARRQLCGRSISEIREVVGRLVVGNTVPRATLSLCLISH